MVKTTVKDESQLLTLPIIKFDKDLVSSDVIFEKFYRSFHKIHEECEGKNANVPYVCSPTDALLLYYWISPATRDQLDDEMKNILHLVIHKICNVVNWSQERLKQRLMYHRQRLVTQDMKLLTEDVEQMTNLEKAALYYWLRIVLTCSEGEGSAGEVSKVIKPPIERTANKESPNFLWETEKSNIAMPPEDDDSE